MGQLSVSTAGGVPVWCRVDAGGAALEIDVHVQPGAARTQACGTHGDRLKVQVAAPPVEGEANRALVAWCAEALGVPRRSVVLARGGTSRRKTLRIEGAPDGACLRLLGA